MAQITAVVSDVADIREFHCLLADDVKLSLIAARLAELARLPSVLCDDQPLSYSFVVKGGPALPPDLTLREAELPGVPILRIVPELVVGGTDSGGGDELPGVDWDEGVPAVVIRGEQALVHDQGLDLPTDIRIDEQVHRAIERFALRDRQIECAGLLLGTVGIEGRKRVVSITAIAPAEGAVETRTYVRLNPAAWESMLLVRDQQFPNLRVLGWFHTHAGWGVFMSDSDVFAHRHFFPHPNMVAYVLDPTTGQDSFFFWRDGGITLAQSYGLVGSPEEIAAHAPQRKRLWARVAVLAALAAVAYFGYPRSQEQATPVRRAPVVRAKPTRPGKPKPPKYEPREQVHVITARDNLWSICNRVYGNGSLAEALAEYNDLTGYTGLRAGQVIKLPPKEVLEKMAKRSSKRR